MAKYTGASCPVCNKRFAEGDDIVVCPICGAPHHRACYRLAGECALHELHIKGHVWQPEKPAEPEGGAAPAQEGCVCPSCGANNPACGLFCQICGAPLKGPSAQRTESYSQTGYGSPWPQRNNASYADALGGLSPEEQIEGTSARDLALFVGENARYFLTRFKMMTERGPVSVNWCAFFFHFLYFFYRKMYRYGAIILGLFALSLVPVFFVIPEYYGYLMTNIEDITIGIQPAIAFLPEKHLWAWALIPWLRFVMIGVNVVFALFANRLYLTHAQRHIQAARMHFSDAQGNINNDNDYTDRLRMSGRTSKVAVIAAAGGAVMAYLFACALVAVGLIS